MSNPYELKHYLNAINYTKEDLVKSDDQMWAKKYPAYIINKIMSAFPDTLMLANEMNRHHHLNNDIQFQFYINSVRKKKRFSPFVRASKLKDIDVIKEYYGFSNDKAKDALKILSKDQIKYIKEKLFKGGTK